MQHDQLTLAYLAGIIDADGYITINRSQRGISVYHGPQIGIAGTRREPHDLAASLWGGKVGCYTPKISGHLPQFQWSRQGGTAAAIIVQLLPFLRVKVDQAYLALDLWEHAEQGRQTKEDPYPWFGPRYDAIGARDEMREEMISLNLSRSRLRKARAGDRLDGIEHKEFPA
jgi:hypothetical protein